SDTLPPRITSERPIVNLETRDAEAGPSRDSPSSFARVRQRTLAGLSAAPGRHHHRDVPEVRHDVDATHRLHADLRLPEAAPDLGLVAVARHALVGTRRADPRKGRSADTSAVLQVAPALRRAARVRGREVHSRGA